MKKKFTRLVKVIAMILAFGAVFSLGANALAAEAARPYANDYIKNCSATITAQGGGKVKLVARDKGTVLLSPPKETTEPSLCLLMFPSHSFLKGGKLA